MCAHHPVLDRLILEGISRSPMTARELGRALDEHPLAISNALSRLLLVREIRLIPARAKGEVTQYASALDEH